MAEQTEVVRRAKERRRRRRLLERIGLICLGLLLLFSFTLPGREFWRRAFAVSGFTGPLEKAKAPLRIHVLDVGKADAVLLECEGHAALLDAGTALSGEKVVDYLYRQGIDELELAILSHPDKDHVGGMSWVLREIPVSAFLQGELPEELLPDSTEYLALTSVLTEKEIPVRTLRREDRFSLGGAECEVLGPVRTYDNTNDASLVFRLSYCGFSALFCGDAAKDAEKDLIKSGSTLSADLLKVAHHGSKGSSTKRFLEAVRPNWAVISVGPDNNNLPREETLERLEEAGAEIYRTDLDGTVIFSWDGETVSVKTEK